MKDFADFCSDPSFGFYILPIGADQACRIHVTFGIPNPWDPQVMHAVSRLDHADVIIQDTV
jgi:hypothetical protein